MPGIRAVALLLISFALSNAQNVTLLNLLSRPDLQAPTLYVTKSEPALLAPGYIMITPSSPGTTNFQTAPYIYNNLGHLVWSGQHYLAPGLGPFDEKVCYYKGTPHLCFTQFTGPVGGGPGGLGSYSVIMDHTYTQVVAVAPSGAFAGQNLTQDLHEFNVLGTAGASALLTSYVNFAHNVTYPACPGSPTTPFTKTGLFTEVSTDGLNTTLFQWNAIDHVDPTDTYVCPGDNNVGTGKNIGDGFDFFHINAIDKDENGDYLVSSRHTSTIFKIAGNKNTEGMAPGTIIWRLGGKRSSFPVMDSTVPGTPNLNFSFQHHARFRPSINGISLWDNANDNDIPSSSSASSGKSVTISTSNGTNKATLIEQYISPDRQLDSSQGSHQFLPNGNHFMGLGSYPYVYEQTSDGTTVFYANWGVLPLQSYRAFKYEWVGKPPITEIALFGYAQNCTAPAAFYASWNGATEVVSWKYFTSSSENGTFALAATAVNNGTFETFTMAPFNLFAYAIAYDDLGNMLGQTPIVSVFVPDAALAPSCNAISCPVGTNYGAASKATCAAPPAPTVVSSTSSAPVKSTLKSTATTKPTSAAKVHQTPSFTTSPVKGTKTPTPSTPSRAHAKKTPSPSSSPLKKPKKTPSASTSPIKQPGKTPYPTPTSSPVKAKKTPSPSTSPVKKPKKTPKSSTSPVVQATKTPGPSTSPVKKPKKTPKPSTSSAVHAKKTPSPSTSPVKQPKKTPVPSTSSAAPVRKTPSPSMTKTKKKKPTLSPSPSSSPLSSTPSPSSSPAAKRY
ncbi:hypothetical protein MMC26_002439 [Xylographa opegraphella]|nr:hypothetical protein [Xylographa opegraphella]